jgi:alpha-beta hydrolase superfamily lysophospholipase
MIEAHKRFRVNENLVTSDKVVFIFTALGTKIGGYKLFIRSLNKHGYSCVIYDYPMSLITDAETREWQACLDDVVADAKLRLARLSGDGVTDFSAHGSSMGTLFAGLLTQRAPEISHTVLNLPYGDVAYSVFNSRPPRKARERFQKDGVSQQKVAEALAYVDPIKTAPAFKGKKVLLYTSKRDGVLKYNDAKRTREALVKSGAQLTYVENKHLGHYSSGVKNILGMKRLVAFLKSK